MGETTTFAKMKQGAKKNALTIFTILGIIAGICMGVGMRVANLSDENIQRFGLPGELFINLLKLITVPIITCSITTGVAKLGRSSGKLGLKMFAITITISLFAAALGSVLAVILKPGLSNGLQGNLTNTGNNVGITSGSTVDSLLDLLRNAVPDNLIASTFQTVHTVVRKYTTLNATTNETKVVSTVELEHRRGINSIGIIVFCSAFGLVLSKLQENGKLLLTIFEACNEAMMLLIKYSLWYSPIGIAFLIASKIMEMDNVALVMQQLGLLTASVLIGQFVLGIIVLPLIYLIFTRKNPFQFIFGISQALLTAFATASGYGTLPIAMKSLIENNEVDHHVTSFVMPIGATINMVGAALYVSIGAIFIAQLNNTVLGFGELVVVSVTSMAVCVASPGMPDGALVSIMIVLSGIGVPDTGFALVISINWLMDRFNTCVNVLGNCITTGILDHIQQKYQKRFNIECNGV